MTAEPAPELSFLVLTDDYATIRGVVECLCDQDVAHRIELVVAAPEPAALEIPDRVGSALAGVRTVRGRLDDLAGARAAAIRAATAPVVVFGETHSFPEPGWARALIDAHAGPWTVVGPGMSNANPQSAVAWSNLLLDYGPFVGKSEGGPVEHLMGHNSSYKRDALLEVDPGLEKLLISDAVLNDHLAASGHQMYFEPAARTRHLNVSRLLPWLLERLDAGRQYAAERARTWPWWRRLVYACGSPLIPPVRLQRILRGLRDSARGWRFALWILPSLLVGAKVSAFGEFLGYALGSSEQARQRLYEIEVHRTRYVRDQPGEARAPPG